MQIIPATFLSLRITAGFGKIPGDAEAKILQE
jgi:hypothetical protein